MTNAPKVNTTSTVLGRFKAKFALLAGLVTIFVVAMSIMTATTASAATTTCSIGASGSTTLPATLQANSTSTIWLLVSSTGTPDLELKVDGNQCVRQTFTPSSAATWQKFNADFNLVGGTRQLTISSFGPAASISKVAIVSDGMTPTGDGSNVTTVTNTNSCSTSAPLGTATLNTSLDDGASNAVWILLSNTSNADLEFKVDGNNCVRQTFATGTSSRWMKFDSTLNLSSGAHQIVVGSYSNGVLLTKIALINNGLTPTGDGSNVIGTTIPTIPVTQPPVTVAPTTKVPVTQPPITQPPVTPTTKLPTGTATLSPGTYDDKAFNLTSGWILAPAQNGENKYNGSDYYTNARGQTASLKFNGTGIEIFGANAPWHGKLTVAIDGASPIEVDEYNSSRVDQSLVFSTSGLTNGEHSIVITSSGAKSTQSSGTSVALDKIIVSTSTTPGTTPPTAPVTVTPTTKVPVTQPEVTTSTKVVVPPTTGTINDTAIASRALAKMKIDYNLASIKQYSFSNGVLTGRAYLRANGFFFWAIDFTANVSSTGETYSFTSTRLILSFTPIP